MQSETGFPSSHQLKSYVAYKSRLKLAARAVLSADAGLLVYLLMCTAYLVHSPTVIAFSTRAYPQRLVTAKCPYNILLGFTVMTCY